VKILNLARRTFGLGLDGDYKRLLHFISKAELLHLRKERLEATCLRPRVLWLGFRVQGSGY